MKVSGQMVAHDMRVVAPARLETAAALLTLAAICTRAGRTADARDRISQAAALIAQGPDPGILASQDAAAQHQAAPMALVPPPRGRARRSDGLSAREAEVLQKWKGKRAEEMKKWKRADTLPDPLPGSDGRYVPWYDRKDDWYCYQAAICRLNFAGFPIGAFTEGVEWLSA